MWKRSFRPAPAYPPTRLPAATAATAATANGSAQPAEAAQDILRAVG